MYMEQKRSLRAALNKQLGHMRLAGRQFDMPALDLRPCIPNF